MKDYDDLYKRIEEALDKKDREALTVALQNATQRMDMDKDREDFEVRYGGTVDERIAAIEKLIAAHDDIEAVREKHGLEKQDGFFSNAELSSKMVKLEELVYGNFISSIKARLKAVEAVKKAQGGKKQ